MADTQLSTNVWIRDNNYDTPTLRQYAASALSRMTTGIDNFLPGGRVDVIFLPKNQIGGSGGWGLTHPSARESRVNSQLTQAQTEYTVLHEISHIIDPDLLDHAAKVTLCGLMSPAPNTAAGGFWGNAVGNHTVGQSCPSECYANTFPQAYTNLGDVAGSYYTTTISSGNFAAYRAAVVGSAPPTAMTVATAVGIGATNVKYTGTATGLVAGDWISVGSGTSADVTQLTVVGTTGSGGSGLTFTPALLVAHGVGATIVETSAPPPGGPPGGNASYQILIGAIDYTNQIPADSIQITESGSDASASCTLTVEHFPGSGTYAAPMDSHVNDIVITNLLTGVRLFGGHVVGGSKRHLPANGVAFDMRFVSHDIWLDRRFNKAWWTTSNGTSTGTKISDDRLIVQQVINNASYGGTGVGLTATNTTVNSTNTSMPKLNLVDGSLRDNIRAVSDAAATTADPTVRRVYVDFYKRVHYFKGNESTAAPYIIGDAMYAATIKATSGLVSYWPMAEASGATCYDAMAAHNITLSGFVLRGIIPGVVNQPMSRAVYFAAVGSGLVTSAAYHPGNTFSIECWFQRNIVGTRQTLFDAGANDYTIEFQANNTLRIYKASNDFTTTATYTDTNWHHLVITHTGAATHVYVDGVDKAGTAAVQNFVPSTNDLYIGELHDGTLKYNGSLQHVAFYSNAMSAANALAHYNDGITLVPDYIDYDVDWNNSATVVYVKGATAAGTGGYAAGFTHYPANAIIDRPESDTAATMLAIQTAWLKRDGNDVIGGMFTISGYDGWRAGQTVSIDDAGLGILGSWEIKYIQTTLSPAGSGDISYDVYYGAMPWRGTFDIRRKGRRNSVGATQEA